MRLPSVRTVAWGFPDDWVQWFVSDVTEAADEIGTLRETSSVAAALLAAVEKYDTMVSTELPGTTAAALWVPGRGVRRPLASATLRVADEPESGRLDVEPLMEFVRERARGGRGERVLDVAAMPSRVIAGDAVLRIVDTSRLFSRQVNRRWTWFVLPPGTGATIACELESSAIAHFDELADMATDIANSVTVTLEPA